MQHLPDVLTLPTAGAGVALLGIAALLPGHRGTWHTAVRGSLAALFLLHFLIHPASTGFGDGKMALAVGAALGWYGWAVLLTSTFARFLFGTQHAITRTLLRRADRKSALPCGPSLVLGALTGLLLGGVGPPRVFVNKLMVQGCSDVPCDAAPQDHGVATLYRVNSPAGSGR